jgi:hypothetical protein
MAEWKFIRTCQACGHEQEDKDPGWPPKVTKAYEFRKCKKCKSESFDLGSYRCVGECPTEDFCEEHGCQVAPLV